jgi:hypothetical protein
LGSVRQGQSGFSFGLLAEPFVVWQDPSEQTPNVSTPPIYTTVSFVILFVSTPKIVQDGRSALGEKMNQTATLDLMFEQKLVDALIAP